jgi:hypothetical protein
MVIFIAFGRGFSNLNFHLRNEEIGKEAIKKVTETYLPSSGI